MSKKAHRLADRTIAECGPHSRPCTRVCNGELTGYFGGNRAHKILNDRSVPDAIQAHTRALLGADRVQTPTILQKLASLHSSLKQHKEAVTYHQKLLALGEKSGLPTADLAESYLAVAEWEMRGLGAGGEKSKDKDKGDWALAAQYLEKVASTNAPQRDKAEEALRELRLREARVAAGL